MLCVCVWGGEIYIDSESLIKQEAIIGIFAIFHCSQEEALSMIGLAVWRFEKSLFIVLFLEELPRLENNKTRNGIYKCFLFQESVSKRRI